MKLLVASLLLIACNDTEHPSEGNEDYESLFPWGKIDTPENIYEDMNVRVCNTEQALNDYRYLGENTDNERVYNVTVVFSFKESIYNTGSSYEFRYINENKEIVAIGTKATQQGMAYQLKSDEIYTQQFKVKSGYPMYMFVNGGGDRASNIKAKISAVSEDGLIVVPILSTEQYQTKRGYNQIEKPFCEYIILP